MCFVAQIIIKHQTGFTTKNRDLWQFKTRSQSEHTDDKSVDMSADNGSISVTFIYMKLQKFNRRLQWHIWNDKLFRSNALILWRRCLSLLGFYVIYHNYSQALICTTKTHMGAHTPTPPTGSHGCHKTLQADSWYHQELNSDDSNGHNLVRQALSPVKACEMCWVINTYRASTQVLLTCGAMGIQEILNIKRPVNMTITVLTAAHSPSP